MRIDISSAKLVRFWPSLNYQVKVLEALLLIDDFWSWIMNIFFIFFKEIKFFHFRLRKCLKDRIDGFSAIIITSLLTLMVLKFIGFCILELLKSCHEIETRMESFLELCGKVVKMRLGNFIELQCGNVLRLIKVWIFLCVFIVYELLETNLNFLNDVIHLLQ